jgi:hypothetical protein
MVPKEGLEEARSFLVQFFIQFDILIILRYDSSKYISRELREGIVLVVFANGEINEMSRDAIVIDLHKAVQKFQSVLVQI